MPMPMICGGGAPVERGQEDAAGNKGQPLPFSGGTVLRSAQGSFPIEHDKTKTKLYCVKHRI